MTSRIDRFTEATAPLHDRLYRIALTLCDDRVQAADLTQEALVLAFRAFDGLEGEGSLLPWLARTLRDRYLEATKSLPERKETEYQLQRSAGELDFVTPEMVEREQVMGWLREELEAMDPDHRLVLILCDMDGLSYEEVSEVAGVPIGTVRTLLASCRAHLRAKLEQRTVGGGS